MAVEIRYRAVIPFHRVCGFQAPPIKKKRKEKKRREKKRKEKKRREEKRREEKRKEKKRKEKKRKEKKRREKKRKEKKRKANCINIAGDLSEYHSKLPIIMYNEIMRNANLMQQGNFIDKFLARHVSGTYAHHQEH